MNVARGVSRMSAPADQRAGVGLLRAAIASPHVTLAGVAGTATICEFAARKSGSSAWMMLAAGLAVVGFVKVWRTQEQLRLLPLLGLTLAFQLVWIVLHLALGVTSFDSSELYSR